MYSNLDAELKRKDITRGELARQMKLTPSTMSLKLNGKSEISLKEAIVGCWNTRLFVVLILGADEVVQWNQNRLELILIQ